MTDHNYERTCIDLFAGLGCWSLAARANRVRTVAMCEIEPWLRTELERIWQCPVHPDIKTFPSEKYKGVWAIFGSPPCQPASLAGKRRGASDDRWLWKETVAICEVIHPAWFCFENPPGIDGVGLDGILAQMEGLGYEVQALRIPACAVNSPQDRDRFWIMGHTKSSEWRPNLESRGCCQQRDDRKWKETGRFTESTQSGPLANGSVAGFKGSDAELSQRQNGCATECVESGVVADVQGDSQRTRLCEAESRGIGWGRSSDPTWQDCEWIEFNGELYRAPVGLYGLADGVAARIPRKFRSKLIGALGNCVVPQIPAILIAAMIKAEEQ